MAGVGQEIIDLTVSPPPPAAIIIDSDSGDAEPSNTQGSGREKRKKPRRKKQKKSRDGEVAGASNQTSRAPSRERDIGRSGRSRHRSRSPRSNVDDLFVVDVLPVQIQASLKLPEPVEDSTDTKSVLPNLTNSAKLLLPAHVSVFGPRGDGAGPVDIIRPPTPDSEEEKEDFIEYLDYDDGLKGAVRYFDEHADDTKPSKFVCKNCGAEGQHKTYECPVQICLTCGARDEHATRSCPISKVCFTCGMKGHINRDCPNRYDRNREMVSYEDCDRCGSSAHKTNECPTWWRMYEYVPDDERLEILHARESKQHLPIGQGGEGFIGRDDWCYNCGAMGHWGDDCQEVSHVYDRPREPSAFSLHNTMSGPFYDHGKEPAHYASSDRDFNYDAQAMDEWASAPSNVGKQGRKKDQAKWERKFQEQEANDDDGDDWFANPRNARNRGTSNNARSGPPPAKKMTFGAKPKLLDRISGSEEGSRRGNGYDDRQDIISQEIVSFRGAASAPQKRGRENGGYSAGKGSYGHDRNHRDNSRSGGEHRQERNRSREREWDRGKRHHREEQRYRGAYSR